jgi:hypothetical protein
VLTKTHRKWENDLDNWKRSVSALQQQFMTFDTLLQPIGIRATDAADLDAQLAATGASEGVPKTDRHLQPVSGAGQNSAASRQVAGVKRKADVIDLTEE